MGYQLPVGTGLIPSIYLAHHREEVYIVSRRNSRPVTPVRRGFTSAAPAGMKMVATPVSKSAKILVTK